MGLTLSDMRGRIMENLGGSANVEADLGMPNLTLTAILNEANHTIESEADWPWLRTSETITTVAGTNLYTPTTGWYRTISIFVPTFWALEFRGPDALDELWPTTDRGIPVYYGETGTQIDLRPYPNGVFLLKHNYYQTEPELIDDADEPLLPQRFRRRLIDMATAMAASRARLFSIQQVHANLDPGHEKRMKDELRSTIATSAPRVRMGTWGGNL